MGRPSRNISDHDHWLKILLWSMNEYIWISLIVERTNPHLDQDIPDKVTVVIKMVVMFIG